MSTMGLRHKKSSVCALACLLIRPLAWVYFQPPLPVDSDGKSEVDDEVCVQRREACRIHFKILQNAVECTAGISTIGAFLSEELSGDNPLARSIEILQRMAAMSGKTCEDAMDVMQCIIARNNEADVWSSSLLLPKSLFSSFPGLLTAEYKPLKEAVEPVFEQVSTAEDIRCLTPEEMSTPWVFKELMRTWWIMLGNSHMLDGSELPVRFKFCICLPDMLMEFYRCSQMLLKFGLVYSRLMSDVYKVYVSLTFVLTLIDATVSETCDDDATAAFGLLAVKYLVDALEDPKLDFGPKRVQATASVPVDTIPSSDYFVPKCNGNACANAELRLVVVNGL